MSTKYVYLNLPQSCRYQNTYKQRNLKFSFLILDFKLNAILLCLLSACCCWCCRWAGWPSWSAWAAHRKLYFLCGGPKTKLRSPTHTQINTKSSKNRLKVKPFNWVNKLGFHCFMVKTWRLANLCLIEIPFVNDISISTE